MNSSLLSIVFHGLVSTLFLGCVNSSVRTQATDTGVPFESGIDRVVATNETWFKARDLPVADLADRQERCKVQDGQALELRFPPRQGPSHGYLALTLRVDLPNCGFSEGLIYEPHFRLERNGPEELETTTSSPQLPFLRLEKAATSAPSGGLQPLVLSLRNGDQEIERVSAVAGRPGFQVFRTAEQSVWGIPEPIPEGTWALNPNLGHNGIVFAGDPWKLEGDFAPWGWHTDLGPLFIPLYFLGNEKPRRVEFGIHLLRGTDGTAGSIGIPDLEELQRVTAWFEQRDRIPRFLVVDWGFGSVVAPPKEHQPPPEDAEAPPVAFAECTNPRIRSGGANLSAEPSLRAPVAQVLPGGAVLRIHEIAGTFLAVSAPAFGLSEPLFVPRDLVDCGAGK